jgi:hypothetical protein
MNQRSLITRLRKADPVAGREAADDPSLWRARIDAILASSSPAPLAASAADAPRRRGSRRPRYRRAMIAAAVVAVIPGAAVAASTVLGPEDVERGLPSGAEILAGSNPVCHRVEREAFDCKLTLPKALDRPRSATGQPITWTSLMVDREDRITGGCRTRVEDRTVWRCYAGQAAAAQHLVDRALLGTAIHDRCDAPRAADAPSPLEAAPGSAIVLCGVHGVFGYSTSHDDDGAAGGAAREQARPKDDGAR